MKDCCVFLLEWNELSVTIMYAGNFISCRSFMVNKWSIEPNSEPIAGSLLAYMAMKMVTAEAKSTIKLGKFGLAWNI